MHYSNKKQGVQCDGAISDMQIHIYFFKKGEIQRSHWCCWYLMNYQKMRKKSWNHSAQLPLHHFLS